MSLKIKEISASQTWPMRHKVMWPDQPFDFVKLPDDDQGSHYGLFVGDQLVSIVSLFKIAGDWQFRKLATETTLQGKGYGSKLLNFVLNKAETGGALRFWCNARADKTAFYMRFGMVETSEKYVKEGIDFVIMERLF